MTVPEDRIPPGIPTDVPTSARMYDYCLGGKDNFAIDRAAVIEVNERFPGGLDAARDNRLFLYRVVRYLARDAGIRQFLDMGSGLPTQSNVHQVAQEFQPSATVVYVDHDPIVLAHGRALLAENERTTVIMADITEPEKIVACEDVRRLLDFDEPMAVLFLSIPHSVPDDDLARRMLATAADAVVPGSYLAVSHVTALTQEMAEAATDLATSWGMPWKVRVPADFCALIPEGLERVEPGLVDVVTWHPDPDQPPLRPVDEPLRRFVGAGAGNKQVLEYGGVMRKP